MKKPTSLLRGTLAAALVGGVVLACYGPTEVVLELRTDLHARNPRTLIRVAGTTATKDGATGDGRIGELVLVPSDARDAIVEVAVVTSVDGRSPDECESSPDKTACVFARRRFKFASHESRSFVVFMSSVCLGKDCGAQTCEDGVCVAPTENKSDGDAVGEPIPPPPPPDAATDGAIADVQIDGPADPLCPPEQRLVTGASAMIPGTLRVNASRVHWAEASKIPSIAYMPNAVGATTIEYIPGDTYAIDDTSIVSTLSSAGTIRRTTFPAGGGVGLQECPSGATTGTAIVGAVTPSAYVTQSGVIQRVVSFDPNGCVMAPVTVEKDSFREIWGAGSQIYANSDAKTLNRVTPGSVGPATNTVVFDGLPSIVTTYGPSIAFVDNTGLAIYVATPIPNPKGLDATVRTTETVLALALDTTHVYWLEPQPGALQQNLVALVRATRGANAMPEIIGRYANAHSLAADERCLYVYGREIARGLNARTGIFARPKTWVPSIGN